MKTPIAKLKDDYILFCSLATLMAVVVLLSLVAGSLILCGTAITSFSIMVYNAKKSFDIRENFIKNLEEDQYDQKTRNSFNFYTLNNEVK